MSASRQLVAGISLTTAALLRWVTVQSQRVGHEIDLHTVSSSLIWHRDLGSHRVQIKSLLLSTGRAVVLEAPRVVKR